LYLNAGLEGNVMFIFCFTLVQTYNAHNLRNIRPLNKCKQFIFLHTIALKLQLGTYTTSSTLQF